MTTPVKLSNRRDTFALKIDTNSKLCNKLVFRSRFCRTRYTHRLKWLLNTTAASMVFMVISESLHAQSFAELEDLLLKHPQLRSMSYQADSSRERSDAAMGLPDPIVSLGINNFPIFDPSFSEFLPTNKAIGVQQRFPSRVSRKARAASGLARANQSDEMRKQLLAAMRAELIALLHEKDRIVKQMAFAKQRDDKYDQLIKIVESEVGGGRSFVFRLAEIEAERADVARTLVDLGTQAVRVDSRLIYLLGSIPDTSPPAQTAEDWSGDAMDFYASRVADAAIRISDSGIDEAKSAWKPELGAQLIYQQREAGNDFAGDDWVSMMVTVTVPFWAKGKQAPYLRAAKASKAAAQATLDNAKRQASAQYAYSKATYAAANEAKLILERKIKSISNEIAAQKANYESGAGDYASVIDGEIVILKLQAEIVAEEARSEIAAAQMNALTVTP